MTVMNKSQNLNIGVELYMDLRTYVTTMLSTRLYVLGIGYLSSDWDWASDWDWGLGMGNGNLEIESTPSPRR